MLTQLLPLLLNKTEAENIKSSWVKSRTERSLISYCDGQNRLNLWKSLMKYPLTRKGKNITPIFKKLKKEDPGNYKQISLT